MRPKFKRLSKVCIHCKLKKIKCDRKKPCSQCKRFHVDCQYNDWDSSYIKSEKMGHLKFLFSKMVLSDPERIAKVPEVNKIKNDFSNKINEEKESAKLGASTSAREGAEHEKAGIDNNNFDRDDEINFLERFSYVHVKDYKRTNFGPFSWMSLISADRHLKKLKDSILKSNNFLIFSGIEKGFEIKRRSITSSSSDSSKVFDDVNDFRRRVIEDGTLYDTLMFKNEEQIKLKTVLDKEYLAAKLNPKTSEDFPNLEIQRHSYCINLSLLLMPPKRTVWVLVSFFFSSLYVFLPILDEADFTLSIERIIGKECYDDTRIRELRLNSSIDCIVFGMLLLIMRTTYCFILNNNDSFLKQQGQHFNEETMRYLVLNPVYRNIVYIAESCLKKFDLSKRVTIPVFQLAMILRFYRTYAPESNQGFDEYNSSPSIAALVQCAYSLGLNREPSRQASIPPNKRLNHLFRKLWHHLVIEDLRQSFMSGCHVIINSMHYDTEIPFYEEGSSNVRDSKLEEQITHSFEISHKFYSSIKSVLDAVSSFHCRIKIPALLIAMDNLKNVFNTLHAARENSTFIEKSQAAIHKIELNCFLMTFYFYIWIYYEERGNQEAIQYLSNFLSCALEIIISIKNVLGTSGMNNYFVIPSLLILTQKVNFLLLSLQLNLKACKLFLLDDSLTENEFWESVRHNWREIEIFEELLLRTCNILLTETSKLSRRYCYAWQITKAQKFFLRILQDQEMISIENEFFNCDSYCWMLSVSNINKQLRNFLSEIKLSENSHLFDKQKSLLNQVPNASYEYLENVDRGFIEDLNDPNDFWLNFFSSSKMYETNYVDYSNESRESMAGSTSDGKLDFNNYESVNSQITFDDIFYSPCLFLE